MEGRDRLFRLLGGAELLELRLRLRGRFERGATGGAVTLSGLSQAERAALCGLLGRRQGIATTLRFDIDELDGVLRRACLADSLREALEILDGPLVDRAAARGEVAQQWRSVQDACSDRRLAALLQVPRGLGLLKRLAAGDPVLALRMCAQAARVLDRLPSATVARAQLAAEVLGDAHGLDAGRPVATLVLAALRLQRTDEEPQVEQEESDRAVWAALGVLVNELARPALCLNLPHAAGVVGTAGEPGYLSLRALLRTPIRWQVNGRDIFVCENPNIVAIAADMFGNRSPPLVCTDGMPAAAQRALLLQLGQAGANLRYHGDFDWPGIAIGNVLVSHFGATTWRFCAVDYLSAVECGAQEGESLGEMYREATWDPDLAPAMRQRGRVIHEEAVTATLLADLGQQR
jgi:uncharacterized protein (TIGR02679 family)